MTLIQRNPFRLAVALALALLVVADVPGNGAARAAGGGLERPLAAGPAATHPVHRSNGIIAFVGIDGATYLDVINPDGSGFRQLVLCYQWGASCTLTSLAWSPDGRRLAFLKSLPNNESLDVINADGSGAKRLARGVDEFFPALSWSPDGSRIVFSRAGSLSIVNVTSGRTVRLTACHGHPAPNPFVHGVDAGCYDWGPAWSPDGSRIVFSQNGSSLDVIRANGSGMRRLVYLPAQSLAQAPTRASWSPDGSRIAFVAGNRIYTVRADGSRRSLLFSAPRDQSLLGFYPGGPFWSPDGRHILMYAQPYVPPGTPGAHITEVWVMNADGTHQRRLFHTPCCTSSRGSATLSPDGTRIAFTGGEVTTGRNTNSLGGIDLMDADGRHLRRLIVQTKSTHYIPGIPTLAWQPRP